MNQPFVLPPGLIGRFAIVKLWPEIKTAEDECISRLKIAASTLGLECIEIYSDGRFLNDPLTTIKKKNVDFVLHLHYDTPKLYDAFSFAALWNPVRFYHEWGYSRTSRNLLTHDDFLSCNSTAADDHVCRLIRNVSTHLPPFFELYHSVVDIIYPPSLGAQKLFYIGINWEAVQGRESRHQNLLKLLDKTRNLRIFGPKVFQGVNVWKGYNSYVREIPFDGFSTMEEISKAGIALVLSSQAHKESELMSNRLFESVAAGALVICDENNFAKKFFGDSLLYIDGRCSVEETYETIQNHLLWIRENQSEALKMVERAQKIFREKFSLRKNLTDLYNGFHNRKLELMKHQKPESEKKFNLRLYLFLPEYSESILNTHLDSVIAQEYKDFLPTLVIDKTDARKYKHNIEFALTKIPIEIEILEIDFFCYGMNKEIKQRRKFGKIIAEVLELASDFDAVIFVAPNEKIFSNHIHILAGSLIRNPKVNCAATAVIVKNNSHIIHGVHDKIDFSGWDATYPIGFARFIFRVSSLPEDLRLVLPYLERKVMAVLVGDNIITSELPATVIIDATSGFLVGPWDEIQEQELIISYCPSAFRISLGHEIAIPLTNSTTLKPGTILGIVKLLRWRWVLAQVKLLHRQGIITRLEALKRKIRNELF